MDEEVDQTLSSHVYNSSTDKQYDLLRSLTRKVIKSHTQSTRKTEQALQKETTNLKMKIAELSAEITESKKAHEQAAAAQLNQDALLQKKVHSMEEQLKEKTQTVNNQRKSLMAKLDEINKVRSDFEAEMGAIKREAINERETKAELEAKLYASEYDVAELQEELEHCQEKAGEASWAAIQEKKKLQRALADIEEKEEQILQRDAQIAHLEALRESIDVVIDADSDDNAAQKEHGGLTDLDRKRVQSLHAIHSTINRLELELQNKSETASALETYWKCKSQTAIANAQTANQKVQELERMAKVFCSERNTQCATPQNERGDRQRIDRVVDGDDSMSASWNTVTVTSQRRLTSEIQGIELQQRVSLLENKLTAKNRMVDKLERNLANTKNTLDRQKKMHQKGILLLTKELTRQLEGEQSLAEKEDPKRSPRSRRGALSPADAPIGMAN